MPQSRRRPQHHSATAQCPFCPKADTAGRIYEYTPYFGKDANGRLEMIDGQQRLKTLIDFVSNGRLLAHGDNGRRAVRLPILVDLVDEVLRQLIAASFRASRSAGIHHADALVRGLLSQSRELWTTFAMMGYLAQHEAAPVSPERSAWIGGQGTEP